MKTILRSVVVNASALWATSQIVSGLRIGGGLETIIFGGITLTLINLLIKPILSVLTLPLNLLTLGLFSWVLNIFLIYLLTVVVSQITITAYTFPGLLLGTFRLEPTTFSPLQTTIIVAFMLSSLANILFWLLKR